MIRKIELYLLIPMKYSNILLALKISFLISTFSVLILVTLTLKVILIWLINRLTKTQTNFLSIFGLLECHRLKGSSSFIQILFKSQIKFILTFFLIILIGFNWKFHLEAALLVKYTRIPLIIYINYASHA
jgi:hypothetical protein